MYPNKSVSINFTDGSCAENVIQFNTDLQGILECVYSLNARPELNKIVFETIAEHINSKKIDIETIKSIDFKDIL